MPLVAAERFDYHSIRKQPAMSARGIYEGELHFRIEGKARIQGMRGFGAGWRGDAHLLWDGVVGDVNALEFEVKKAGNYLLALQWTLAPDYGIFEIQLNGKVIEPALDLYSTRVELAKLRQLGEFKLKAGKQRMVIKLTGGNPKAKKYRGKGYLYGMDYLKLTDLSPKPVKPEQKEEQKAHPHSKPVMKFDVLTLEEVVGDELSSPTLQAVADVHQLAETVHLGASGNAGRIPEERRHPRNLLVHSPLLTVAVIRQTITVVRRENDDRVFQIAVGFERLHDLGGAVGVVLGDVSGDRDQPDAVLEGFEDGVPGEAGGNADDRAIDLPVLFHDVAYAVVDGNAVDVASRTAGGDPTDDLRAVVEIFAGQAHRFTAGDALYDERRVLVAVAW